MTVPTLADNPAEHCFDLTVRGAVAAQAHYEVAADTMKFTHTEVLPGHEGKGFGSKLAKFALDAARERNLKVVPVCDFIAGYIRKNPDYLPLVTDEARQAYKL